MSRKAKCKMCSREIDPKEHSHYKFGRDYICYVEASEDCVVDYASRHFQERGDGSGRMSGEDY